MSINQLVGISESEFQAEIRHHEEIRHEAARLGPISIVQQSPLAQSSGDASHRVGLLALNGFRSILMHIVVPFRSAVLSRR